MGAWDRSGYGGAFDPGSDVQFEAVAQHAKGTLFWGADPGQEDDPGLEEAEDIAGEAEAAAELMPLLEELEQQAASGRLPPAPPGRSVVDSLVEAGKQAAERAHRSAAGGSNQQQRKKQPPKHMKGMSTNVAAVTAGRSVRIRRPAGGVDMRTREGRELKAKRAAGHTSDDGGDEALTSEADDGIEAGQEGEEAGQDGEGLVTSGESSDSDEGETEESDTSEEESDSAAAAEPEQQATGLAKRARTVNYAQLAGLRR